MIETADKAVLRRLVREKIASLPEPYIRESDEAVCAALLALPELKTAKRVFAYFSVGLEVSTRSFIELCFKMGKAVALPVTLPGGIMYFADITSVDAELPPGALGIPQPPGDSEPVKPMESDILLVPALCYDREGFRLGQGGGYYDRYLAGTAVFTAGLCRRKLLAEYLPRLPHDIPVSLVVTD